MSSFSSSDTVSTQTLVLYTGSFVLELVESTTGYTFNPCVGSFTSPGIDTK